MHEALDARVEFLATMGAAGRLRIMEAMTLSWRLLSSSVRGGALVSQFVIRLLCDSALHSSQFDPFRILGRVLIN